MDQTTIAPITKTVTVSGPPDRAFQLFTERFGEWWPLRTHSIGEADTENAFLEPRVGGRIYEVMRGGREAEWGKVTACEPPGRLEFDWQVSPRAPGVTHVVVTFTAKGESTLVELEHSGWEIHGDRAEEARGDYAGDGGWTLVLSGFAEKANGEAA